MNAFTELRQNLHIKHSHWIERDIALAEGVADTELQAHESFKQMIEARRFSFSPDRKALNNLLKTGSQNHYVLRSLAEGLKLLNESSDCAGVLRDSNLTEKAILELAAEAGIEAFSGDEIRRILSSGSSSGLEKAVMAFAAVFPGKVTSETLISHVKNVVDEEERRAAWIALAALDAAAAREFAALIPGYFGPAYPGPPEQPLVLQTVFYGDPGQPGKAGSGGIGSLVLRLGNSLAEGGEGAATLACRYAGQEAVLPVREMQTGGHVLFRLPLMVPHAAPLTFLEDRHSITLAFRNMLNLTGIRPQIIHVRFLDDASLAVAREARRRQIPCAVTLTPDPHRSLVEPGGGLRLLSDPAELIVLHRIWVGDELARISRGIMAIGRDSMRKEIVDYFPELENVKGRVSASVDEGVPDPAETISLDIPKLLTGGGAPDRLNPEFLNRPMILSVGRLAAVKNLPSLAEAWSSGLWRTHNLVIVGGDLDSPGEEEGREAERIRESLNAAPKEAGGMAVHIPAQPSETIRQLETWLSRRETVQYPSLYVASSLKEEFGLAILEAMSTGLISCAPIQGGAGTYIRSGVNSFLIDTRNGPTIFRELSAILESLRDVEERSRSIAESARDTVKSRYSLGAMAREYSRFYRSIPRET